MGLLLIEKPSSEEDRSSRGPGCLSKVSVMRLRSFGEVEGRWRPWSPAAPHGGLEKVKWMDEAELGAEKEEDPRSFPPKLS